ncbi:MAG: hypothetical protein WCK05_10030 [Planctomycetota bacterium]
MRDFVLYALMALAATTATSCSWNEYVIEMTPRGDTIDRKLTASVGSSEQGKPAEILPEEKAVLAKAYAAPPVRAGQATVFSGTFTDRLPSDVGGRGIYLNETTAMGSLRTYAEDFRGNDEPAAVIEKAFRSADTLGDLLAGFLRTQVGTEPDFDKLDRFLRGPFCQDLKNLSMYAWAASQESRDRSIDMTSTEPNSPAARYGTRAGLYLLARGYFEPGDVKLFSGLAEDRESAADNTMKRLLHNALQKIVNAKAGVRGDAIVAKIEPLITEGRWTEAFEAYVAKVRGVPTSRPGGPAGPASQPVKTAGDVVGELMMDIALLHFDGLSDRITCILAVESMPVTTNGKWDPQTRKITWSISADPRKTPGSVLPSVCYAFWAEPDAPFQSKHLGKPALTGEPLRAYCLWRSSLTESRGREWDAALASMNGPQDLPKLLAFRFSDEPKPPATQPEGETRTIRDDYYRKGAKLIAGALAPKPAPAPASRPAPIGPPSPMAPAPPIEGVPEE